MTTEIELKYLVFSSNTVDIISTLFSQQKIEFIQSVTQLSNCYFDTPDLNLRKHDMGLRIREKDGALEQTLKTAGKVVGGLHQRPEFNIPITAKHPELRLFPHNVWEASQQVEHIQTQLTSLFSTDFTRHIWLVNTPKSGVVEVVFDQGEVTSNGLTTPICEIELELVRGDVSELFDLAALLLSELNLRPGLKSKAARGYELWNDALPVKACIPLTLFSSKEHTHIDDWFINGLTHSLTHLQQSVEHYTESPSLSDLAVIKDTLILMKHGFVMFNEHLLPESQHIVDELRYYIESFSWVEHLIYLREVVNKTGNYRKKIDYSEELVEALKLERRRFPNIDDVTQVFHSQRFNQLQLSLLSMLMPNYQLFSANSRTTDLQVFATQQLTQSLNKLISAIPEKHVLTCEEYIERSILLNASLHTGIWFSGLFDKEERAKYRAPWLDLKEGIAELQVLWLIQKQLERLPEQPKKLVNWQNSKVDNLLHALQHSKQSAMSITPYWL